MSGTRQTIGGRQLPLALESAERGAALGAVSKGAELLVARREPEHPAFECLSPSNRRGT